MLATLKRKLVPQNVKDWILHRRGVAALQNWTEHDEEMKRFYAQLFRPGELVFDVGANVGNRSKIFLALGATVVAVEPQPACAGIIRTGLVDKGKSIHLVPMAMGSESGRATMHVSSATGISTMSDSWLAAVKATGRFGQASWNRTIEVEMQTLDHLITQFGLPRFIKVDVEGFELQVLQGLTQPVSMISLEFTPETSDATFACIEHLRKLGPVDLNYSNEESMQFACESWLQPDDLRSRLETESAAKGYYGDVYIRSR